MKIDHLPVEVLEMIFLYLDKTNRLRCKLVSKYWEMFLMTNTLFSSDRHLNFKNCSINLNKNPATVLMSSKYGYNKITLNNRTLQNNNFNEIQVFWKCLGKSVTEISFQDFDLRALQILKELPKVRVLECRSRWCLNSDQLSKNAFQNIEILQFYESNLEILIHSIKVLKKIMPNLKEIHPGLINSINHEALKNIPGIVKGITVILKSNQSLEINVKDFNNITINSLIYHTKDDFNFLNQLIESHINVREVKVWSTVVPKTPLRELTDLTFELKSAKLTKSLKLLESIPNLKSLFMICKYDGCCFVHEYVLPKRVEKVKLFAQKCDCSLCFSFINNSFPNLKHIHCDFRNKELKLLTFQAHILKTVSSMLDKASTSFISKDSLSLLLNTMHNRPKMETADLKYFCLVSPEDIIRMYEISPNLQSLKISFDNDTTTLDELVFSIFSNYKTLTEVHLYTENSNFQVPRKNALSSVEILTKHGGILKDLYLPLFKDVEDEYVMETLFCNLLQLTKFRDVTRHEFEENAEYQKYNLQDCFIGQLLYKY